MEYEIKGSTLTGAKLPGATLFGVEINDLALDEIVLRLELTETRILRGILTRKGQDEREEAGLRIISKEVKRILDKRTEHTCHAEECNNRVEPEMLMCRRHWKMVPRDIQQRVWERYKKGQCYNHSLISREYIAAQRAAVAAVADQERKDRAQRPQAELPLGGALHASRRRSRKGQG